ncbi:hypothetical protein [Desmospora profundinema]|uniref:Uncharacterized protein n=1 Tax=Desmospora profundinema TaxID=1571184 RepID=A0ABU1IH54_9BACL|nr:hypothetical protein [Desmospora profundinema]MDR6224104.1 hypothetical protein [Desmospora profundinema]
MKKRRLAQKGMDEKVIVMSDLKRMVVWIVIAVTVTAAGALWMEMWR